MVAFEAPSPDAVDTAYAAGLASGGMDEGIPGSRPLMEVATTEHIYATLIAIRSTSFIVVTGSGNKIGNKPATPIKPKLLKRNTISPPLPFQFSANSLYQRYSF